MLNPRTSRGELHADGAFARPREPIRVSLPGLRVQSGLRIPAPQLPLRGCEQVR